jgi:hypothetical protein
MRPARTGAAGVGTGAAGGVAEGGVADAPSCGFRERFELL